MAKIKADAWQCDDCGHVWLVGERGTSYQPERCPQRDCRSTKWNAKSPDTNTNRRRPAADPGKELTYSPADD